jgi:hypothetical protein
MFSHRHYVPILKWKMGEYQALSRLDKRIKDGLMPLLEIPPVGFDFETGLDRKSADEHLADFGKRLKAKWDGRPCFVDLKYVPPTTRLAGGIHFVEGVFADIRASGAQAIPVITLSSDPPFLAAAASVVRADNKGVCLRLNPDDFDRGTFAADIEGLLRQIGATWADADLVIDFGTPTYTPITAFVRLLSSTITLVPALNRWRTFTLAGTSYPSPAIATTTPFQLVPRREWEAYRAFVATIGREGRIPTFGDYAVAQPDPVALDMRFIKPVAKLRYTIDDLWYIARGTPVRTNGFGQFRDMCDTLKRQSFFDGRPFSAGDEYIEDCAAGTVPTGNLSTWVWVATNRHLTKVVSDLAIFHGLSVAAE